jgi:hypothetical protein
MRANRVSCLLTGRVWQREMPLTPRIMPHGRMQARNVAVVRRALQQKSCQNRCHSSLIWARGLMVGGLGASDRVSLSEHWRRGP